MKGAVPPTPGVLANASSEALERAQIYQFFEMSLAHPSEYGFAFFRREAITQAFVAQFADLVGSGGEAGNKGLIAAGKFASLIRGMSFQETESAHAALFQGNTGRLPRSTRGSLVSAADCENWREEMNAVKSFLMRQGMNVAETADDLPDYLCIELKFMRSQCLSEHDAAIDNHGDLKARVRAVEAEFLGRYLTPFASRLADTALQSDPANPYSHLLDVLRHFVSHHHMEIEPTTKAPALG
jgi:TorA maturation chaperone TorD